jgi:hypothetical protein
MITTLYIVGKFMLACIFFPVIGPYCSEVIGNPYDIIVLGGFEFMFELGGMLVFKKRKDN